METYIKKDIRGNYATFAKPLDNRLYNNIGTTWEDFCNGFWVKLDQNQLAFKENNYKASVEEVFNTKLNTNIQEITIDDIKDRKKEEIMAYDSSFMVNEFFIDGKPMWFSKQERANLIFRFEAERKNGLTETKIWYNNECMTFPIDKASDMIFSLEVYASKCYDCTKRHISNVDSLNNIQDIKEYNYQVGYPEKLNFNQ